MGSSFQICCAIRLRELTAILVFMRRLASRRVLRSAKKASFSGRELAKKSSHGRMLEVAEFVDASGGGAKNEGGGGLRGRG